MTRKGVKNKSIGSPLSGVRVLDLSRAAAGPFGAMILGDLGAEIIKIEPPEGDITRTSAGPSHKGEGFHYLALNRNKKGMVLDLGSRTGKRAFNDLVKIADVVWDNFRPGVMERLGADYRTLREINSRIICCSISGYGPSGPYQDRPSWDPVVLGVSGLLSTMREPGRPPVRPGSAIADLLGGLYGSIGVLAALRARDKTGEGSEVNISLLDACVAILTFYVTYYFLGGGVPEPLGSGHLGYAPMGVYQTKEGSVALGICWPRICRVLGAEQLMDDPRFSTQEARVKHRKELDSILTELFSKERAEDWLEILYAEDIAAGPVNTVDKVVCDPQVVHNEMIISLEHPLGGEVRVAGNPIKMAAIEQERFTSPPTLGQHTDEILTGLLGYSPDKVRRLKREQEQRTEDRRAHLRKAL